MRSVSHRSPVLTYCISWSSRGMVSHTLTGDGGTSPESIFDYDFHDELPIIDVYMASNRAPNSPDVTW